MYLYDNNYAKMGLIGQKMHQLIPSKEHQRLTFLRVGRNVYDRAGQLFHIISIEWFNCWKAYVGIEKSKEKKP